MTGPAARSIAVLAPGGIGAPIGALLTKAGHDVVLIDQWVEHVETMKARGLYLEIGTRQDLETEMFVPVRAHHLYEVATLRPTFDVVLLTAKSYDTQWLVEFIKPYLKDDGVLVSMQNSLNEEWIAPVLGAERVVGCVLTGGGELLEPGWAWRNRSINHPYYTLGEIDGEITPRLLGLVELLSDAGKSTTTTNLLGAKWTKLIRNSQAAVSSLCNMRSWKLLDEPRYIPLISNITREAIEVGQACGYRMEPINGLTVEDLLGSPEQIAQAIVEDARVGGSEGSISMVQQDMKRGRPSEVARYLNGLIVRKGGEVGVPTPVNEAITDLHLRVERHELPWDMSNFELAARTIEAAAATSA
jgi:2-dehydropantoate 2-reductase